MTRSESERYRDALRRADETEAEWRKVLGRHHADCNDTCAGEFECAKCGAVTGYCAGAPQETCARCYVAREGVFARLTRGAAAVLEAGARWLRARAGAP